MTILNDSRTCRFADERLNLKQFVLNDEDDAIFGRFHNEKKEKTISSLLKGHSEAGTSH